MGCNLSGWQGKSHLRLEGPGWGSLCQCPSVFQCHWERYTKTGAALYKPLAYRFSLASLPKKTSHLRFHTDREAKEGCTKVNQSSKRSRGRRLLKRNTIKHSQYIEDSFSQRDFYLSLPYWRSQRHSIYRAKFRSRIPLPFLQPTKELQLQNNLPLSLLTTGYSQKHDIDDNNLLPCYKGSLQVFIQLVDWKIHIHCWIGYCVSVDNFLWVFPSSIQGQVNRKLCLIKIWPPRHCFLKIKTQKYPSCFTLCLFTLKIPQGLLLDYWRVVFSVSQWGTKICPEVSRKYEKSFQNTVWQTGEMYRFVMC